MPVYYNFISCNCIASLSVHDIATFCISEHVLVPLLNRTSEIVEDIGYI